MRGLGAIVLCLALAGCTTLSNTGVHWYNPGTWFSGSAGRTAATVAAKIDTANDKAVTEAQRSAHATQVALSIATTSRPIDAARASNDNTVSLLDQVSGPLTASDLAGIREQVRLLTSDLAEERAKGAASQRESQTRIDFISSELSQLREAKKKSDEDLAVAFGKENALANELRNEKWWSWFWRITIGSVLIVALVAYVYLRFTVGGLPTALSGTLATFRKTEPELADKFTSLLDVHTSPAEQSLIRLLIAKKS